MEYIKNMLEPDEKILWSGKTKKVSFLDNTNKIKNFIKILLCQAGALSFGIYTIENATKSAVTVVIVMTLIFELIAFYDYFTVKKVNKASYFLTSNRIISFFDENNVSSIEYEDIKDYFYGIDKDGNESLIFGKSAPMWIWRNRANGPFVTGKNGICIKGCVYALEDFDSFKKYFEVQLNK